MSFNNANQVHMRDAINVTGGNQYNYAYNVNSDAETLRKASDAKALRILAQNAAPNACYDSEQRFPPPNCHEGTRLQILEKLSSRIEDKSKANSVLWLHGSAGVGKSAIAQHLAEKYAKSGRLAAAFFFSRSDSTRNNIGPLVASIVYQFCQSESPLYTTLAPAIIDVVRSNPNIFRSSCESQVQKLITQACSDIDTVEEENPPNIIIIDGLDECINRAEQERVLAIVRVLISYSTSYFSWIILLCSRPEPQIRYGFDHKGFEKHLETFDVNSLDDVNRDIHQYLVDNFATLRTKYRRVMGREGSSWPGEDVIGKLVARADGQFIFAATVIKYLDVDDEPPQHRLDTILRIYVEQEESPYSALDTLYHQILSTCRKWGQVQALLRLLVTPHCAPPEESRKGGNGDPLYYHPHGLPEVHEWRSLKTLADFLNIPVHEVSTLLIRLHAVLQIPDETDHNIQFAHATFTEFLADPNRSGEFYTPAMSEPEYCDCVATLLLRTLSAFAPSYPLYHIDSFDSAKPSWFQKVRAADWLVVFSCRCWSYYCSKVITPSANLLGELENMDVNVVVAISLELDRGIPLEWDGVINWAKVVSRSHKLGNSRTDVLVEKLEMTMMEVYIAFEMRSDYQARRRAFEQIFTAERRLLGLKKDIVDVNTSPFEDAMFEALRTPPYLPLYGISRPSSTNIHIVPKDIIPKISNILLMARLTRDYVCAIKRICSVRKRWDSRSAIIRLLLGYVVDRTFTIFGHSGNPVRYSKEVLERDLVCFAMVFKERLAAFNLDVKWSESSFWLVDATDQDSTRSVLRGSPLSSPDPDTTSHLSAGPLSSLDSPQAASQSTGT
ncbi:hypothetical protein VNI00_019304, partial [Paramarasmius palmivorus]